jgi:hypothetical protein
MEIFLKFDCFLVSSKSMPYTISDDYDEKGRFSLPEIDNSNQQEKTCHIKKGITIFQKEQV